MAMMRPRSSAFRRAGAPDRRRYQLDRFSFLTGGSRVTFATGMATTQAAEKVVEELKKRAAMIWDIAPDASNGRTPGVPAAQRRQLRAAALGRDRAQIGAHRDRSVRGVDQRTSAGPGFATHICMSRSTRRRYVKILRYTAVQDVGAPSTLLCRGQIQAA